MSTWPGWSPTSTVCVASDLGHLEVPETGVWASADEAKVANRTIRPSDLYFIVVPLRGPYAKPRDSNTRQRRKLTLKMGYSFDPKAIRRRPGDGDGRVLATISEEWRQPSAPSAKINLGLAIGPVRDDGFHALATLLSNAGSARPGDSRSAPFPRLPLSASLRPASMSAFPPTSRNTAWKMVERALEAMGSQPLTCKSISRQRLPVQGGLGAGSANAVAALIGLKREQGRQLGSSPFPDRIGSGLRRRWVRTCLFSWSGARFWGTGARGGGFSAGRSGAD